MRALAMHPHSRQQVGINFKLEIKLDVGLVKLEIHVGLVATSEQVKGGFAVLVGSSYVLYLKHCGLWLLVACCGERGRACGAGC
jgi:hypothetical protein